MAGRLSASTLDIVSHSGLTIRDGIRAVGGDPARLAESRRAPGSVAAFVELHIEQGAILDESDIDIGVVEGIVGIRWWDVTVEGVANHAGTTPMDRRRDALVTAAEFALAVNRIASTTPGTQVATVGRIQRRTRRTQRDSGPRHPEPRDPRPRGGEDGVRVPGDRVRGVIASRPRAARRCGSPKSSSHSSPHPPTSGCASSSRHPRSHSNCRIGACRAAPVTMPRKWRTSRRSP